MICLYYETGLGRIGRSLEFGLETAVAMLTDVIAETSIGSNGWWYCKRVEH